MFNPENDFDPADFDRREAADRNVYVKFYMRPVVDQDRSNKEGRPIYVDREYIEIRTPGNQTNVVQRPVTDMDRKRFRQAYQSFKAGNEEQVIGTPLVEVPWITRSMVEELAHLRIRTLEHLAGVNDDVCGRIPGLYSLKEKAQAAIQQATNHAPIAELQARNEALVQELAALKQTVEEQAAIIRSMNAEKSGK